MTPADFTEVLALNEESVKYLSPLSSGQLASLHRQAAFHRVVEAEGRVVAFILALRQGADYDSVNYQWVARTLCGVSGRSIAWSFPEMPTAMARARSCTGNCSNTPPGTGIPVVACEFDVEPPNPASERFRREVRFRRGRRPTVGRLAAEKQCRCRRRSAPRGRQDMKRVTGSAGSSSRRRIPLPCAPGTSSTSASTSRTGAAPRSPGPTLRASRRRARPSGPCSAGATTSSLRAPAPSWSTTASPTSTLSSRR